MAEDDGYFNLGTYRRSISNDNAAAQIWFTRGLIWCYGFNHEEAAVCFERSIQASPNAMAYWGLAFALGPNYNKPWDTFGEDEAQISLRKAHDAAVEAKRIANFDPRTSPVEHALVDAIQQRYPVPNASEDRSQWNRAYVAAMKKVYEGFSDDPDVVALYADAMMNLTPWSLWDLRTGLPRAGAYTLEIKAILENALAAAGGMEHAGLTHLYIHLMEMSTQPEKALPAANALRLLVPDAGHLNHMPTHIDILVGNYADAMVSNLDAIRADDRFFASDGVLSFYTLYRCHDYHFRIYAAMFAGNYHTAYETVTELEASIPESILKIESPPMADWLEGFISMRIHVLIRFGKWAEILDIPLPEDAQLYCATTAMIHYGRGMALAALGRVAEAAEQRYLLQAARLRVPRSRTLFNNTCQDILAVGATMLDGELEYRRGNYDTAFDYLREAVQISGSMKYDEPWGWMQPPRHALGALLLEQGHVEEAAEVYCADLGFDNTLPRPLQHPNNIWSLQGYYLCLKKLQRSSEAQIIKKQLDVCAATADVKIKASCFCANAHSASTSAATDRNDGPFSDTKAKLC